MKVLTRDRNGEPGSLLMRWQAGAVVPEHVHHRAEECLVVEGDLLNEGQRLGPGDFAVAQPSGTHALRSPVQRNLDCIFLSASASGSRCRR